MTNVCAICGDTRNLDDTTIHDDEGHPIGSVTTCDDCAEGLEKHRGTVPTESDLQAFADWHGWVHKRGDA